MLQRLISNLYLFNSTSDHMQLIPISNSGNSGNSLTCRIVALICLNLVLGKPLLLLSNFAILFITTKQVTSSISQIPIGQNSTVGALP